jgi:hypothetical protein
MDANPEQPSSEQPVDRRPYIGEDALKPLARMIARRILAERTRRVGISGDGQPGTPLEAPGTSLTDQPQDNEG